MTNRRWQNGALEDDIGPLEETTRAELFKLGWSDDMPPGEFKTAARHALTLAETMDHTNAARDLAAISSRYGVVMQDVRAAARAVQPKATDPDQDDDVDDFTRARQRRQKPPPAVGE